MPRYTIKLNTYDPVIVKTFERLRKNRKQAAFTHEALKYFLSSEKGAEVINLMCSEDSSPDAPCKVTETEYTKDAVPKAEPVSLASRSECSRGGNSDVIEKIFK